MIFRLNNLLIWCLPLIISFYTLSYARWLWLKKEKIAAVGVVVLAAIATVYPGILLFIVHN